MGEMRNERNILVGEPEGQRLLRIPEFFIFILIPFLAPTGA
jgi:hypothetical protein